MTRRNNPSDPTAERTSDTSTQTSSGITNGRPARDRVRNNVDESDDEMIPRNGEDSRATPSRYEQPADDPVMPSNDSSITTKI